MANVKAKGTVKLFDNKLLEALTRTNPLAVLAIYLPISAVLAWYFWDTVHPSTLRMIGLFFGGLFIWTLTEYLLHRFLFHFVNEHKWTQKMHFFIHGVHHEYPKDKDRLVLPPVASLIVAIAFFFTFRFVMGPDGFMFFSGFIFGYLCYDMIHYILHHFRPPHNFLKFLWEFHNMHHFRYPEKAYGVSSPFWDLIFGTYPPKLVKKKSEAGN